MSMRVDKKAISITTVLILISTYVTLYTVKAHNIAASHIYKDSEGKMWWRTTPCGSLFPWPKEPGMLQALSKVDVIDLVIYTYLIKTWVLVGASILMWIGTGLFLFRVVRYINNSMNRGDG